MAVVIMQIITFIANIYLSFTEKKKRIYIAHFLVNFSQMIMYFINRDIATACVYIIASIRAYVYIYKNKFKSKLIPIFAIAVQLVIGIFTIDKLSQVLSVFISCYACYYLWFYDNTQKLRVGNIIANTLWAIYNLYNNLYIIFAMRIITIGSNIVAYNNRKRELNKEIITKNSQKT